MRNIHVIHALLTAALFGTSTPFAKLLVGGMSPWLLAGARSRGRTDGRDRLGVFKANVDRLIALRGLAIIAGGVVVGRAWAAARLVRTGMRRTSTGAATRRWCTSIRTSRTSTTVTGIDRRHCHPRPLPAYK
ncbi:MAG: hypothetical protein ABTQ28_14550 [Thauera sp.]|jgi:hypothetical protein